MAFALVEQLDIQGNILAGYSFDHALFVVLRVTDPEAGRRWLGEYVDQVTTAVRLDRRGRETEATVNVAFTYDGLRALGVSAGVLECFPDDFRQGMAARAHLLGDDSANAPARWELGIRPGDPHVLVTLTAKEGDVLAAARGAIAERAAGERVGVHIVHELSTSVIKDPNRATVAREHFGFADGLAQPSIAGRARHRPWRRVGPTARPGQGTPFRMPGARALPRWKPLAAGEFVLGYRDEAGLVAGARGGRLAPFLRNGSYMVVRKLRQDVALFNRYMDAAAGSDGDPELLAAKVVGRWRDGTPLVKSPAAPPARTREEPDNNFRYGKDPYGFGCPLGAHIRRSNPRDSLGFGHRLTARHRIIRRGMPYGPPPADGPGTRKEDGIERGLMFVCYQASIERQFEVIQGRWLSDGDAFGLGDERDFLLGGGDPVGKMTLQGEPPRILAPRRSFVLNRGGGYFFAPGIAALRALANGV